MTSPVRSDLIVYPGADLEQSWRWKAGASLTLATPVSLTGYSAVSAIRYTPGGPVMLDLAPYFTFQANGDTGRIDLAVPGLITATIDAGGIWDLLLVKIGPPADRTLLLSGDVNRLWSVLP